MTKPVTIKRYAHRRFYQPDAGTYVTLGDLSATVEDSDDSVVCDAATGSNVTHSNVIHSNVIHFDATQSNATQLVLQQIIIERAHHG